MNRNIKGVNGCAKDCHEAAVKGGWWHDDRGIKKDRNVTIEEVVVAEEKVVFKLPKEVN